MLMPMLSFVGTGLLLVILSLPLVARRVPPNSLYGLRVPSTFANEEVWYEANARSGRDLLRLGLVLIVLAIALPALGLGLSAYALAWSTVAVVGVLVLAITGWRRANRLLREQKPPHAS